MDEQSQVEWAKILAIVMVKLGAEHLIITKEDILAITPAGQVTLRPSPNDESLFLDYEPEASPVITPVERFRN